MYVSVYLCLQFLSSVSYNFPGAGLLPPWLNLFHCIFYEIVKGLVFLISLSDSLLLVYKMQTISKYLFCILVLY